MKIKAKKKSISKLDKDLWEVFSEYTRRRYADEYGRVKCFTCSNVSEWKKMDAGHFISRRHTSTKFDELNVMPQCKGCNIFGQGKQFEFALNLDKIYGEGTAENLLMKSKILCKRDRYDFEMLIEEYKNKLNEL
jgi:hypothetical protein